MKYLNDDRNPRLARGLLDQIGEATSRPVTLLDAVGGQALNLLRFGTDRQLPEGLKLVHGPACPVCALPPERIDEAVAVAETPGVTLCAPGDLLRVPGTGATLEAVRARGGDVRTVYSALDALAMARKNPNRSVVYLAAGFETTAPAAASAVLEADRLGLEGFTLLNAQLRTIPGLAAALDAPAVSARALLAPGPVATVIGLGGFESLTARYGVPVVVTGPEPLDLLEGILRAVRQIDRGAARVENQYARAVRADGSPLAIEVINTVFEPADVIWRGLGEVVAGGLALRERFRRFDATARLGLTAHPTSHRRGPAGCRCGEVIAGAIRPDACPAFAALCAPDHPLGAPMVSPDGTCSAYHRYRRLSHAPRSSDPLLIAED
ncbi:MAG: hydrogenase formation protein HypD [Isosphaeraceae bacterium]